MSGANSLGVVSSTVVIALSACWLVACSTQIDGAAEDADAGGSSAKTGGSTSNTGEPTSSEPTSNGGGASVNGTSNTGDVLSNTGGAAPGAGGSPSPTGGNGAGTAGPPATGGGAPSATGGAPSSTASAPATGGAFTFTTSAIPATLPAPCDTYAAKPTVVGTLFTEAYGISGIVASRDQPGVYFVHSDRQKILYAIDQTGRLLGQWEVTTGAAFFFVYNWEDISIQSVEGGPDRIWIGDIGNNFVRTPEEREPRTSIKLMSIEEPQINPTQVVNGTVNVIGNFDLTYPDALHDAEGMAIDPLTGDAYVFSKEETSPSKIFRAQAPIASGTFVQVGTIDATNLNAADFSPSGRELLVRDYMYAYYYARPADKTWLEVLASPPSKKVRLQYTQGFYAEAIGFSADESGFYVVFEQEEGVTGVPVEFYAKACQ